MMTPRPNGPIAFSRTREAARERMSRYITVLTLFASFRARENDDVDLSIDDFEWDGFRFKQEFFELEKGGYVTGDVSLVLTHPRFPKGTSALSRPGITVSGIMKLAELSDYLWRTSIHGKIVNSLVQLSWLIVGVIIGCLGSLLFAAPGP